MNLKKYIPNLDEMFMSLSTPLKNASNNYDNNENFIHTSKINLSKYNLSLIIKHAIDKNFNDLSPEVEKVIASSPSSDFHSYFQFNQQEYYKNFKDLRRKLRNKYAARICRKKRLDESDQLNIRNSYLKTILKFFKSQVEYVKAQNKLKSKNCGIFLYLYFIFIRSFNSKTFYINNASSL